MGLLCAGMITAAASGQSLSLKPKFAESKSDFFEQIDDVEQTISGPMAGGDEALKMKIRNLYCMSRKVQSASKETASIAFTYDRFGMNFDGPMMPPIVYDSDLKEQDADAAMVEDLYAAMLGSTVKAELNLDGTVKSINGLKEMVEKVDAKVQGNPFWMQMKEEMTDDIFAIQMFKSRYSLLPAKEVKPGDTWDSKTSFKMPRIGTLNREMKCTLKSVDKKDGRTVATISYEGKISSEAAASQSADGMAISMESGSEKGTLHFDVEAGDFVRTETESQMKMKISMGAGNANTVAMVSNSATRIMAEKERAEQKKAAAQKPADAAKEKGDKPTEKAEKPK